MVSKRFELNKEDLKKLGKGVLIASVAAILTVLEDAILTIDFQGYTPAVVAVNGILVNFIRKYLAGKKV